MATEQTKHQESPSKSKDTHEKQHESRDRVESASRHMASEVHNVAEHAMSHRETHDRTTHANISRSNPVESAAKHFAEAIPGSLNKVLTNEKVSSLIRTPITERVKNEVHNVLREHSGTLKGYEQQFKSGMIHEAEKAFVHALKPTMEKMEEKVKQVLEHGLKIPDAASKLPGIHESLKKELGTIKEQTRAGFLHAMKPSDELNGNTPLNPESMSFAARTTRTPHVHEPHVTSNTHIESHTSNTNRTNVENHSTNTNSTHVENTHTNQTHVENTSNTTTNNRTSSHVENNQTNSNNKHIENNQQTNSNNRTHVEKNNNSTHDHSTQVSVGDINIGGVQPQQQTAGDQTQNSNSGQDQTQTRNNTGDQPNTTVGNDTNQSNTSRTGDSGSTSRPGDTGQVESHPGSNGGTADRSPVKLMDAEDAQHMLQTIKNDPKGNQTDREQQIRHLDNQFHNKDTDKNFNHFNVVGYTDDGKGHQQLMVADKNTGDKHRVYTVNEKGEVTGEYKVEQSADGKSKLVKVQDANHSQPSESQKNSTGSGSDTPTQSPQNPASRAETTNQQTSSKSTEATNQPSSRDNLNSVLETTQNAANTVADVADQLSNLPGKAGDVTGRVSMYANEVAGAAKATEGVVNNNADQFTDGITQSLDAAANSGDPRAMAAAAGWHAGLAIGNIKIGDQTVNQTVTNGFDSMINSQTNAEASQIAQTNMQRLAQHKDVLGKTAEQLKAEGKSPKDVAETVLGLREAANTARESGNAELAQKLQQEQARLQQVQRQLQS